MNDQAIYFLVALVLIIFVYAMYLMNRLENKNIKIIKLNRQITEYENHICVLNDALSNRTDKIKKLEQELFSETLVKKGRK